MTAPLALPLRSPSVRRWVGLALLDIIFAIALFFRLSDLSTEPPGLHRGAAEKGIKALDLLHHWLIPFYVEHAGAPEPLMVDLQARAFSAFGVSIFSLRIVSALVGVTTAVAAYFLGTACLSA